MINATYFPKMQNDRYMGVGGENVAKYKQLLTLIEEYMGTLSMVLWVQNFFKIKI